MTLRDLLLRLRALASPASSASSSRTSASETEASSWLRNERLRSTPRFSRSTRSARSRSFQRSGRADASSSARRRVFSALSSKTPPELVQAVPQLAQALGELAAVGGAAGGFTHARAPRRRCRQWRSSTAALASQHVSGSHSPWRV